MDWTNYSFSISQEGPTFNPPPSYPTGLNGLYNYYTTSEPVQLFRLGEFAELSIAPSSGSSSHISMRYTLTAEVWEAFDVDHTNLIDGSVTVVFEGTSQDLIFEGTYIPPVEPLPQVSRTLIKSKMPAGQRPLLNYANGILSEISIGQIENARDLFAEALYFSTAPRTRSAVTVQATKEAERNLREAIRAQIGDVPANKKEKKVFILAKEGPAFRAKMQINQIVINGLRGKPVGVDSWFDIEIRGVVDPEIGLDITATKPNTIIAMNEDIGSRLVQIRGRWAWRVKGVLKFGPYTAWKEYKLPAYTGNEPE